MCREFGRGGQKHRLDLRRKGLVHARHLHLVVEIAGVAQPPDHDRGEGIARRVDRQIVVGGHLELEADLVRHWLEHLGGKSHPLLGGEQWVLVVMGADGDDELVDEMGRPAHDVDVTVGDGIEASWIETDAHGHLLAAPRGASNSMRQIERPGANRAFPHPPLTL